MKKKLYIIGAGTGAPDFLTKRAIDTVKGCDEVYSTAPRFSRQLLGIREEINVCPVSDIHEAITSAKGQTLGLLVSGDTGFFSITRSLLQELEHEADIETICGISCLQYFCSRIGISYEGLKQVSLHGREMNIAGAVSYNSHVFALTGGINKVHEVCRYIVEIGLPHVKVTVGEKLSMPGERVICATARELSEQIFDGLAVMLLENPYSVNCHLPLYDEDFVRGNVPMTKEEVRAVVLAKLAVQPGDTVYDIGAGTGAVTIEMARRAFDGCVFAVERNHEAIELIRHNRKKLGAYNVRVIEGTAPSAIESLPAPARAFIGGSSGNIHEITELLLTKNPGCRIAANTVTLEGLAGTVKAFEKNGLETEVVCLNVSAAKKVGSYHMMSANNPVYVITGKPVGKGKDTA